MASEKQLNRLLVSVRLGRTKIISTAGDMRHGNVEARVPKNKTEGRRSQVQGSWVQKFRVRG
jgi:hypothetical protein